MTPLALSEIRRENAELKSSQLQLEAQITELLKSDPGTASRLQADLVALKARANMWTDNIFILRQFVCSKLKMRESVLNEWFDIPPDLDLIE